MLFAVLANLGRPIGGIIMTELSNGDLLWINEVGDRFEEDWHEGKYPRIEDLLGDSSGTLRCVLLEHLLGIELELRRGAGEVPLPDEYLERFPDHRAAVAAAFREQQDTQRNDCQKSAAELGDPTLPIIQGFNVLRLLGAGTFGEVWLAEDLNLDRRLVALKVLKPRSRSTAEERQRVLHPPRNEAGLLSKVKHRNVNQVFFWVQSDGNHFLVLNHVAGGSLGGRMKRDGSFGWQDAARYIADVGEGLQAVHARGIVHRDIKPSNILGNRTPTKRSWPTSALRHSWATCLAWGERWLHGTRGLQGQDQPRTRRIWTGSHAVPARDRRGPLSRSRGLRFLPANRKGPSRYRSQVQGLT